MTVGCWSYRLQDASNLSNLILACVSSVMLAHRTVSEMLTVILFILRPAYDKFWICGCISFGLLFCYVDIGSSYTVRSATAALGIPSYTSLPRGISVVPFSSFYTAREGIFAWKKGRGWKCLRTKC
jgi:hypothetical protein